MAAFICTNQADYLPQNASVYRMDRPKPNTIGDIKYRDFYKGAPAYCNWGEIILLNFFICRRACPEGYKVRILKKKKKKRKTVVISELYYFTAKNPWALTTVYSCTWVK